MNNTLFPMNPHDSNNHKICKSTIYMLATMAISALLVLAVIAAGNNYGTSVAFGQLGPMQASGGNATTTTGANATTTASTCMTQIAGQNATTSASAGNTTTAGNTTAAGSATTSGNATTKAAIQAALEARMHVEEACKALQNNDSRGALMHLGLAITSLDKVQSDLTTTTSAGNATNPLSQLGKLFGGK
jgi:hypothetical protein